MFTDKEFVKQDVQKIVGDFANNDQKLQVIIIDLLLDIRELLMPEVNAVASAPVDFAKELKKEAPAGQQQKNG